MISTIDLILEMNITPKDVYKSGTEHELYRDHKDPNKIYRVVMQGHPDISKQAYDWVKIFKQYPQYFPIVYKSTERGASVEKLDANKAHKEFNEIENTMRDEMGFRWFEGMLKDIAEGDNPKEDIAKVGTYLQQEKPQLVSAFKRFITLMFKLQPINSGDYTLDAHGGNFGYDKQGHLKMLDI